MLNYSVKVGHEEELGSEPMRQFSIGLNPFPGLRPFTIDESHLFFGREGQVDEILEKLGKNHSVTVMGYSGSGKSSLMHCGLVPTLYGGFMTNQGPHWIVLIVRPGNAPIENLTQAAIKLLLDSNRILPEDVHIHRAIISSVLRSGSNGLVELTSYLQTELKENVFFLVDQFEELFRFKSNGGEESENEALLYTNLVIHAVHQRDQPVYVALNMRSDFIGECAAFPGLAQMINESNYLVPQMTRDQKRLAIEGPVAVGGGQISPRLVKRLLSDMGDNQDQLPIMQHALMRTWDYWVNNHEEGEPMDIRHYNSIGKVSQALSLHANEAFDELNTREKEIAEILFKSITEKNQENQGMRRATRLGVVAELASAQEGEVIKVVEVFRKPGRSFLMPGGNTVLNSSSIVELSHESLMRIWNRLNSWVDEEHESAHMYKRISDAAAMYQIGKTGLWRPPDLQLALNWQKKQRPTRTWAQRYDIAFERAVVFLDTSRITYEAELKNQELLQRRILRRSRITSVILAILLLISIGFFLYGFTQQIEAQKQTAEAIEQANQAKLERAKAEESKLLAEKQTKLAVEAQKKVEAREKELESSYIELQAAYREAERQTELAKRSEALAESERDNAIAARAEAFRNLEIANAATKQANQQLLLSIAQQLGAKAEGIQDKNMAGLAAMQGFLFHSQNGGRERDAYIFRGLYYALTKLNGLSYNAVKVPGNFRNRMYALAVSRTDSKFFTTGNDGRIFAGDFEKLEASEEIAANAFPNRVLALSPDEKYLVNGSDSSFMQIINLTAAGRDAIIKVKGHKGFVNEIKFLPFNGGFLSTSSDRTIRLTQVDGTSKVIATSPVAIKSMDINAAGTEVVAVAATGQIMRLDLRTNQLTTIHTEAPNRVLAVAYHPTRQVIAYGVEVLDARGSTMRGTVKLFDLRQNKVLKSLEGHISAISDLDYSPDGTLLASAGLDNKLQMWVVDKEEDLPILMDNNNMNVWDIAFAKGSDYLIASSNNGEIRVWPTNPKTLAEQICPKLTRNMTPEEWEAYVGNNIDYESTCRSLLISNF